MLAKEVKEVFLFFSFGYEKIQNSCFLSHFGSVWYIYLRTENYCLKIFIKIRVDKEIYKNTCNIV